jgi:hypothetical protein
MRRKRRKQRRSGMQKRTKSRRYIRLWRRRNQWRIRKRIEKKKTEIGEE